MKYFFQIFVMMVDLIMIASLITIYKFGLPWLAIGLLIFWHFEQKANGGWFFAWRPSSMKRFKTNWDKLFK